MKAITTIALFALLGKIAGSAQDGLEVVPVDRPQQVFPGQRAIHVTFRNTGNQAVEEEMYFRLLQTTVATAALVEETHWKTLTVLPGQTLAESPTVELPAVRAETHFVLQWCEGTNRMVGVSPVVVQPANLLQELRAMIGEEGRLGTFDPSNRLKPLLENLRVEFEDLENHGVAGFRGQLAILGPFDSKDEMPGDLARRIQEMAGKGVAAVWMQPPLGPQDKLRPSFESVAVGAGTVVVVQHDLVADLANHPQSQLNLIHCCRLALHPEPPRLPYLNR